MLLFALSLLAGALTVLAPCTISLLPVIVGGSLSGEFSYRRALTVTVSLALSVILFTLILKVSTALISIPQEVWQYLSGGIIAILGITMVAPSLYERLPFLSALNRRSNVLLASGYTRQTWAGDVLVGAALGPVFSTCSPTYFLILATVLPAHFAAGMVYLVAYAIGLCVALLLVSVAGQKLLLTLGVAADSHGWFKRSVGALLILVGLLIVGGYDKVLERTVAATIFDVTKIEERFLLDGVIPMPAATDEGVPIYSLNGHSQWLTSTALNMDMTDAARVASKARLYPRVPELVNPSGFINTPLDASGNNTPISLREYAGKKVVLVDFWTYSCINCQRTLPYLKAWDDKYRDSGLQIIGIHTPEFAFEKVKSNVVKAIQQFGLTYPSVQDNEYETWRAFGNRYWPRKYLVDIDGFVVYDHAGEGNYEETERAIQKALEERKRILNDTTTIPEGVVAPSDAVQVEGPVQSPETYFGSARNINLGNGNKGVLGVQNLTTPPALYAHTLYLDGVWDITSEYARSDAPGTITFKYSAKDVYFVASSPNGATLRITVDGIPVSGGDVQNGKIRIQENRLYSLVQGSGYGEHVLKIEITDGTLDAYTFTFG